MTRVLGHAKISLSLLTIAEGDFDNDDEAISRTAGVDAVDAEGREYPNLSLLDNDNDD